MAAKEETPATVKLRLEPTFPHKAYKGNRERYPELPETWLPGQTHEVGGPAATALARFKDREGKPYFTVVSGTVIQGVRDAAGWLKESLATIIPEVKAGKIDPNTLTIMAAKEKESKAPRAELLQAIRDQLISGLSL